MKFNNIFFGFILCTAFSLILPLKSVEPFKAGEEIKDPTRTGLTEEQRLKEAAALKDRYEQTNEDLRKQYEKLSKIENPEGFIADVISKKEIQKKFASGDQKIQLQEEIDKLSGLKKTVAEADKILSNPETQKLIQQRLQSEFQPTKEPTPIPTEIPAQTSLPEVPSLPYKQPSLFTRVLATVNEGWARLNEWLGNKDRAIEVYNKLNNLYQQEYGKEGALYQARTNSKIAGLLDNAQAKLQQHIEILKNYQSYADPRALAEVRQTIDDLLLLGKQVAARKDISADLKKQVDTEIDKTLQVFNIPTAIRVRLEEQVGIMPAAERSEAIENINKQIEQTRAAFADPNRDILAVFKDASFDNYLNNVRQLELSLLNLPSNAKQRNLLVISEGYRVPAEAAIDKLVANGSLSNSDRVDLLNQFLTFNKKSIDARKQFTDEYRQLVKNEGRSPTTEELQGLPLYSVQQRNVLTSAIETQVVKMIEALKKPDSPETSWNTFQDAIAKEAPRVQDSGDAKKNAVTAESLQARAAILKDAYGRILEAVEVASITNNKYVDQYANILAKLHDVIDRESTRLSRDAASLVNVTSDNTLELMNAAPPPPPLPPTKGVRIKTPQEQKQEKFVTDNKPSVSDEKQKVLFEVINFNTNRLKHIENPGQKEIAKSKPTELHSALTTALDARSKYIEQSAKQVEELQTEASEWD